MARTVHSHVIVDVIEPSMQKRFCRSLHQQSYRCKKRFEISYNNYNNYFFLISMGYLKHFTAGKTIKKKTNKQTNKKYRLKTLIQIDKVSSRGPYRPTSRTNNLSSDKYNRFTLLLYRAKSVWRLCLGFRILQSA